MHVSHGLPYPLFASTPHDLAITSAILRVHKDEGLDLLHAHYALPHAVSAILARSAAEMEGARPAPRVVTTLHGTDITIVGSDPSYAPLTQYLISASDAATAVSESLARDTARHFCPGPSPCPIEVIPNFVDTERFAPPARPRKTQFPSAVHVSNFRPVKRVPWLIEAFARATADTAAELMLVGDGPTRAESEQAARRLGLGARVRFLGERDALPELLGPADVFLLSSSEESFGLSALEAMSCGIPVVATAVGGVPEVIRDGVTGFLSPAEDLPRYAERIRALLLDRERARAMGAAAREDVLARFARDPIVGQYESLYRRVLARSLGERCGVQ
jgi:N-acetyl-alpha-D-glucosaminyl L-malate synthase BshA